MVKVEEKFPTTGELGDSEVMMKELVMIANEVTQTIEMPLKYKEAM